jgi:molybdopterin converting factor small subunit
MNVIINIPSAFRRFTGSAHEIEVDAVTITDALLKMVEKYPRLQGQVLSQDGEIRGFINVFLNAKDIRQLQRGGTPVARGDVITLVPAVAGG